MFNHMRRIIRSILCLFGAVMNLGKDIVLPRSTHCREKPEFTHTACASGAGSPSGCKWITTCIVGGCQSLSHMSCTQPMKDARAR